MAPAEHAQRDAATSTRRIPARYRSALRSEQVVELSIAGELLGCELTSSLLSPPPIPASVADADADRAGARAFVLSILLDDLSDDAAATRAQPAVAAAARALRAASVRLQLADARGVDRSAEAAAAAR